MQGCVIFDFISVFIHLFTPHNYCIIVVKISAWMKVFRIVPEFRILRLTFHRKSASKSLVKQILIASLIYFLCLNIGKWPFKLEIVDTYRHTANFKS